MDRQTTLAFILIGIILMIWLYITAPNPPQQVQNQNKQNDTLQVENKEQIKSSKQLSSPIKKNNEAFVSKSDTIPVKTIVIETKLARYELTSLGANFKKVFLKKFRNWYSADSKENKIENFVQLINYSKGNSYGLVLVTQDGIGINTSEIKFDYNGSTYYSLKENDSITITFKSNFENNRSIQKSYTFYSNSYEIKSDIEFINFQNHISNNLFDITWENGIRFVEHNSVDEANYSDASVFSGGENVIVDASSVGEKISKNFGGRIDWIAVRNKYFASVIIPSNPDKIESAYIEGIRNKVGFDGLVERYDLRLTVPFENQINERKSFSIFIGPVDYDVLEGLGRNLVELVNFGSFFGLTFVVRPIAEYVLLPLFQFLHSFIPNYGIVIIIFSLIIKILVYPLTKSSYQSMKKIQALQPKIAELKEKFKDDPQKLNKETMKLYSTYGINPAGGCLPILLQMPIFIALWGMFQSAIDLRLQPFVWWIKDLSNPDVIYDLGFKIPLFGVQQVSGLALLMGITTFIQQKMTVKDPTQKALVYIMPIFLTILFMSFPSGLNLYYFMFNLFSIIQQWYINRNADEVVLVPVANPNKKGFMARMLEAAEQQAKQQQKKKK
ncbi:MAG: membrane protein insertase YidC [Ignavibacterium sp.]|nr:membrane protein insertase YidC [Ignavibacterium sp.]MDW8374597.1 membrane protein insertase YidC [Ignavibacteriales bacterium]